MKNLIYKELKLVLHPTNFIFLSFGAMLLIPNYPSYVASIYMCLSVFFLFLTARENKDVFYTSLLPIKKTDQVKARIIVVMAIELALIILSIPFAIIHFQIYPTNGNMAGIEPNLAYFGFQFGMYAVFNLCFIPAFYKTAYKIGLPFLFSSIILAFYFILVESLVWIPNPLQTFFDSSDTSVIIKQCPVLLIGVIIWIGLGIYGFFLSAKRFQKVDV